MSKPAIAALHDAIDALADDIDEGTLVIQREGGRDYAVVTIDYLAALEAKADAFDQMTECPEQAEARKADLIARMKAADT